MCEMEMREKAVVERELSQLMELTLNLEFELEMAVSSISM